MKKTLLIIESPNISGPPMSSHPDLWLLGRLLCDNIIGCPEVLLPWLENPDNTTGGDATSLYYDNGKVIICEAWWGFMEDENGEEEELDLSQGLAMEAPRLLAVVKQYISLHATHPDAILIEQDDTDNITMRSVAANEIESIRKLIKPN